MSIINTIKTLFARKPQFEAAPTTRYFAVVECKAESAFIRVEDALGMDVEQFRTHQHIATYTNMHEAARMAREFSHIARSWAVVAPDNTILCVYRNRQCVAGYDMAIFY